MRQRASYSARQRFQSERQRLALGMEGSDGSTMTSESTHRRTQPALSNRPKGIERGLKSPPLTPDYSRSDPLFPKNQLKRARLRLSKPRLNLEPGTLWGDGVS